MITFSGSPPLSGCSRTAFFLNAFLTSSVVAPGYKPINSYNDLLSTLYGSEAEFSSSAPPKEKPLKPLNPPENIEKQKKFFSFCKNHESLNYKDFSRKILLKPRKIIINKLWKKPIIIVIVK